MTNEEKVLAYIENNTSSPLFFSSPDPLETYKDLEIDNLILKVLELSRLYRSYRKVENSFVIETWDSRYRSSIDIWRHIISVKPDITIFEVMRSLFKISDKLYGQYCTDVHRRVFKNLYVGCPYHVEFKDYRDEYNLLFYDWESIGL